MPVECRSKARFVAVHEATRAKRVGKSGQLSKSTSTMSTFWLMERRILYGVATSRPSVVNFAWGSSEPEATTSVNLTGMLGPKAGTSKNSVLRLMSMSSSGMKIVDLQVLDGAEAFGRSLAMHDSKALIKASYLSSGLAVSISALEGTAGSTSNEAILGGSGTRVPKADSIVAQRSLHMTDGIQGRQLHKHRKDSSKEWMVMDSEEM